jgi:16S rRNA processing protein RimM
MSPRDKRICVGVITGAHGVRGAVRLKSFTAEPENVGGYGPLEDERGERRFALRILGNGKGVLIAAISGIDDRDRAEALRGQRLYLPR